jgi:hypothetical protein
MDTELTTPCRADAEAELRPPLRRPRPRPSPWRTLGYLAFALSGTLPFLFVAAFFEIVYPWVITLLLPWITGLVDWVLSHPVHWLAIPPLALIALFLASVVKDLSIYWFIGLHGMLAELGLRLTTLRADARYLAHVKDPILYLRSFTDEPRSLSSAPRGLLDLMLWAQVKHQHEEAKPERVICEELHQRGEFVALARPGERLSPTGATRITVDDSEWREAFGALLASATLIVFNAMEPTPSLCWEVQEVVRRVHPCRIIFFLTYHLHSSGPVDPHVRQRGYDQFRMQFGHFLPHPLPDAVGDASFLGFGPDWTPILFGDSDDPKQFDLVKVQRAFRKAADHAQQCAGGSSQRRGLPTAFRVRHAIGVVTNGVAALLMFGYFGTRVWSLITWLWGMVAR